jgi:Family of unknown function (DUF6130)
MSMRFKGLCVMPAAAAGCVLLAANTAAQSAIGASVPTPLVAIEKEPPPKLIVDPPLAAGLPHGIVLIPYRVENVRIVPVFGTGPLNASPRVGHLHIHVDDLPWLWADASNVNTIDLAGMPPGQHKVLVKMVNANHQMFPGCTMCSQAVTFTILETQSSPH